MALYKRGNVYWYEFVYRGTRHRDTTHCTRKEPAQKIERDKRRELEEGIAGIGKDDRLQPFPVVAKEYQSSYEIMHPPRCRCGHTHGAKRCAECGCVLVEETAENSYIRRAIRCLTEKPPKGHTGRGYIGDLAVGQIGAEEVIAWRARRMGPPHNNSARTANQQAGELCRVLGKRGEELRFELKKLGFWKLKGRRVVGRKFEVEETDKLQEAAKKSSSPHIRVAHAIAFLGTMRDGEMRRLQLRQIDMEGRWITVGESKSEAGSGRLVPIDEELHGILTEYLAWYKKKFGQLRPEWYLFPFGRLGHQDTTRFVTTFKTAWNTMRKRTGVKGRWHDNRHTAVTTLKQEGAKDETVHLIAGHSSAAASRIYTHMDRNDLRAAVARAKQRRDEERRKNGTIVEEVSTLLGPRDGQINFLRWLSFTKTARTDAEFWMKVLQRIKQDDINAEDEQAVRVIVSALEEDEAVNRENGAMNSGE